jgi:hypothetical protein
MMLLLVRLLGRADAALLEAAGREDSASRRMGSLLPYSRRNSLRQRVPSGGVLELAVRSHLSPSAFTTMTVCSRDQTAVACGSQ